MGKQKKPKRGTLAEQLATPKARELTKQANAAMAAAKKNGKPGKSAKAIVADIEKNGATKVREPAARKEYMMRVKVRASSKEIEAAAGQMAHQVRLDEAIREETREINADLRARRNAVHERMKELADTIEGGTKKEERKVRERLIVETNTVEIVRLDTGEIVETRAASASDRQETLFGEDVSVPDVAARNAQAADKAIAVLEAVEGRAEGAATGLLPPFDADLERDSP